VFSTARTPIESDDTAQTLHDRLSALGAPLLADAVDAIEAGRARETPQAEVGVTYARKIDPAEARIDWTKTAREIDLQIRGLSPFPGAWFELPGEKGPVRMKALLSRPGLGSGEPGEVLDDKLLVACGDSAVRLLRVQREGRQAVDAGDFLRGAPIAAGTVLR
jgi:methionyl-tRNA formyltransferase